ncbi:enoyl-CoA hydratase/carnithine racemase [Novosphingobium hassiacum]|uniref:Enoyl-CoA hydratase/carnithine racemase n=1 Tax=Novosphingobium hassiacum TaxID=173676 RepID=A0A7W5ZVU6_9SPHN|nr:enoyl-CoA hydratase/isomerase family protein [Novosphingobium hassiacum]MBB3860184.1 enoyl-CoA hydratase/carnithine racemase [Novosphingobium hassiacum]
MPVNTEIALDGRVAVIRLDRPGALNALGGKLLDALDAALDSVASLPDARVVVITGSDKVFSVGADLKEALPDRDERIARMHRLALRITGFPLPTIAAIEGWALGGGMELAMACTFRVAAPGAKLGLPEIKLGVIPSYGGTQLAPRLIGNSRALELLCLGDPITAERAEAIGLVNWLAPEQGGALALAMQRAGALAERHPAAIRAARQAVDEGSALALDAGLAVEARVSAALMSGTDAPDAAAAFRAR